MSRNSVLFALAIFSFFLIWFFVPDSKPESISSLEGVTLSDLESRQFKLAGQFVEKPLLLVFWSITCGGCIEEIAFISRLSKELEQKVTIIGVHPPGYPMKKIQTFVKRYGKTIPYLLAIDEKNALIDAYNVTLLPRTLLVDRRGSVLFDHTGYDIDTEKEVENAITKLL